MLEGLERQVKLVGALMFVVLRDQEIFRSDVGARSKRGETLNVQCLGVGSEITPKRLPDGIQPSSIREKILQILESPFPDVLANA